MGRRLVPDILKAINYEVDNTVLSYIPNTAESAYYGMIQGFEEYLNEQKTREITSLLAQAEPGCEEETQTRIREILSRGVRAEKVAWRTSKCALSSPKAIRVTIWRRTFMTLLTVVCVPAWTIWW